MNHLGGSNGDEDGSGGQSQSRQGAETGTFWPPNLFSMVAELCTIFWKIFRGLGFSRRDKYIVQRAASGGFSRARVTYGRGCHPRSLCGTPLGISFWLREYSGELEFQ